VIFLPAAPYFMHYLALDIFTAFALYIYEKFGQGFASRGWSLDVVIVLEKTDNYVEIPHFQIS
jgi:hypothetical protein